MMANRTDGAVPGAGLSRRAAGWVGAFESLIYGIAFLLLAAAAVLIVIGSVDAALASVTHRTDPLAGGTLVLDRVLLVLIIAELAYTLRNVLQYREIAAEPFLLIGLIAVVRRILIVTAAFEQGPSGETLTGLLYELGALGLLILTIAGAIFLLRRSSRFKFQRTAPDPAA